MQKYFGLILIGNLEQSTQLIIFDRKLYKLSKRSDRTQFMTYCCSTQKKLKKVMDMTPKCV